MTNPKYTPDQIQQITEDTDPEGLDIVIDVITEDHDKYDIFDQGRIYQIINTKTAELLAEIRRQKLNI